MKYIKGLLNFLFVPQKGLVLNEVPVGYYMLFQALMTAVLVKIIGN